jgi:uncharacterized RDD family membrane protein YckC
MHCQYCGLVNGEDDHRCLRCGRRIIGIAISAPTSYIGATALAVAPMPSHDPEPAASPVAVPQVAAPQVAAPQVAASRVAAPGAEGRKLHAAAQPPLFQTTRKVIPFEQLQRQAAGRLASPVQSVPPETSPGNAPARKPPAQPRAHTKKTASETGQASLDFHPNVSQERILATGVPAQLYGDACVAPPVRRLTAGAMDVSMVLLGFGLFAGTVRFGFSYLDLNPGVGFGAGKAAWITLAASLILISLFYGLLWAVASRETAGMNWAQLHLVTFDGSPLDSRDRAIRFMSAWLSYCSGGLGLLWALADEESLAFHDHISKTYPAEKASSRAFVRQRT